MFSRLDYFFVTAPLISHTVASELGAITWSDHAPLTLDLSFSAAFPRKCHWRLNESLLKHPETNTKLEAALTEYFLLNEGSVPSVSTLWEAHKAFFRGQCIALSSQKKKDAAFLKSSLISDLLDAERALLRSPTVGRLRTVTGLRNRIKALDMSSIDKTILWAKQKFYEFSNKPHKMLVSRLNPRPFHAFPEHLKLPDGSPTFCPQTMTQVFGEFYKKLYNCLAPTHHPSFDSETFEEFMSDLKLPKLSDSEVQMLNAPITGEEITHTVKSLPSHKAPGPDGLSYSYYKNFLPILSPHLVSLYNSLLQGNIPHQQFLHSYITVIPKQDKDPTLPDNYRPIALLNSDYKLFTKILANRLSQFLTKLIDRDQVGFVPTRHAGDNTRRTIDLIDMLNRVKRPALILSLDAQKAFDRLSWPYMFATLTKFGIHGPFLSALTSLYSTPSSQVRLASFTSQSFPMTNGTRQGCPLSPLLFILCLEPLAEAIRSHPDITGVPMRQREYKISLFADDVLLTLTKPHTSLPSLHALLSQFSSLSGYKVNTAKTEALPLHIPSDELLNLKGTFSYRWCTSSLRYLGVQITPSYSSLYSINYLPLFQSIKTMLSRWTSLPLSWIGRINVLKMSIMPKLLYFFETLPVPIPMTQIKILKQWFLKFIWSGRAHRVASSVIFSPRDQGGMGAPDIYKYYLASHLRTLVSWSSLRPPNRWSEIEMGSLYPTHPCSLVWSPGTLGDPKLHDLCLSPMVFVLRLWRSCLSKFALSSICPPLSNVLFNPLIPDSLSHTRVFPWAKEGLFQLRHFVHPVTRKVKPFPTLQTESQIPEYLRYSYLQIVHYFSTLSPSLILTKPTSFELLCSQGPYQAQLISSIYHILQEQTTISENTHSYMYKWSQLTQRQISVSEWSRIWSSTSKISRCVAQRETAYKVLLFWYKTPEVIHRYDSSLSPLCWRCGKEKGSHFHIFWQCDRIVPFWSMVAQVLQQVLPASIPLDPIHCLLGLPFPGIGKAANRLAAFILLAARRAIPSNWLSTLVPTQTQLIQSVRGIRQMEYMTAMVEDGVDRFDEIWAAWDVSTYGLPPLA